VDIFLSEYSRNSNKKQRIRRKGKESPDNSKDEHNLRTKYKLHPGVHWQPKEKRKKPHRTPEFSEERKHFYLERDTFPALPPALTPNSERKTVCQPGNLGLRYLVEH
jgi:hypothetical protein